MEADEDMDIWRDSQAVIEPSGSNDAVALLFEIMRDLLKICANLRPMPEIHGAPSICNHQP